MIAILIIAFLLFLAFAGPAFGADTRSSKGWKAVDPGQPLWSDAGIRPTR